MNPRPLAGLLAAFLALGCGPALVARPTPSLGPSITGGGELVYVGRVFPLRGAAGAPTYVYERRVDTRDGGLVSTHVTRDPAGAIQIAESATHRADYTLARYTLHTDQLGQSGEILVDHGEVTFRITDGTHERTQVERVSGPVVVGPTLVGTIVGRLDDLERGATVRVRLAVLERLETIGFDLRVIDHVQGETRVRMSASSFLVGLLVDPITFTFETSTRKLLRLEGRVPPKLRVGDHWSAFDARVEYDFFAAAYR